jgi:hypothetical protein
MVAALLEAARQHLPHLAAAAGQNNTQGTRPGGFRQRRLLQLAHATSLQRFQGCRIRGQRRQTFVAGARKGVKMHDFSTYAKNRSINIRYLYSALYTRF